MSFTTELGRNDYVGNGAVDTYDYNFKIFDDDHLRVVIQNTLGQETELVKTTDYTVTGVLAAAGGQVALVNSAQAWLDGDGDLKTGYALTILRVLPLEQETDLRNQGSYFPEDVEDQLDKCVMIDIQQQEQIARSVKIPETVSVDDFNPELPADIADSPNKVIVVNALGTGLELLEASEIASLAGEQDHALTDGQAATNLVGETVDSAFYTSRIYDYELIRGTTVFVTGRFSVHYRNAQWYLVMWSQNYDDAAAAPGLTLSVTGTTIAQLQAALDSGAGSGSIKIKGHNFDA
jgi:hypothetical protein